MAKDVIAIIIEQSTAQPLLEELLVLQIVINKEIYNHTTRRE